jgi:hypothetical protein
LPPEDSIYCPHCGSGVAPRAKTGRIYAASILFIFTCASSLIFLILSTRALLYVYTWYPATVAQEFYTYIQMLFVLSLLVLVFGGTSAALSYRRLNYKWAIASGAVCTVLGGCIWVVTLIVPWFPLWSSILYYLLPQFAPPLVGTILILPRRIEFQH